MNKLKLLIPTIAVMATTPLTALCGCTVNMGGGDAPEPEPEYESVEMGYTGPGSASYETEHMTFEKGKCYKIWTNNYELDSNSALFLFRKNRTTTWSEDIEVIKVVVKSEKTEWNDGVTAGRWQLSFSPIKNENFEIYLRISETMEDFCGYLTYVS